VKQAGGSGGAACAVPSALDVSAVPVATEAKDSAAEAGGTTTEDFGLECSVWDAALLCAMRDQTGSLIYKPKIILNVFVLTVANLLMQVTFMIAISQNLVDFEPLGADALTGLIRWRLYTGHDYDNIAMKSMTTMQSELCDGTVQNLVSDTYGSISQYMGLESVGSINVKGDILCYLSMILWVLSNTKEYRRIWSIMMAIINLKSQDPRTNVEDAGDEGKYVTSATAATKGFLIVCILLPRFLVSAFLLVFGLEFLAVTVNIGDIILNACALEFISGIDELIFEATADHTTMARIDDTVLKPQVKEEKPEEMSPVRRIANDETGGQFGRILFVLAIATYIFRGGMLKEIVDQVVTAEKAICGYDTGFAFTTSPVSQLPIFTPVSDDEPSMASFKCFYAAHRDMIAIRAGYAPEFSAANETLTSMMNGSHESCAEATRRNVSTSEGKINCPEYTFESLTVAKATSGTDYYQSDDCHDQDVAMIVLSNTCVNDTFTSQSFFTGRVHCQDYRALCECHGNSRRLDEDNKEAAVAPPRGAGRRLQPGQGSASGPEGSSCSEADFATIMTQNKISYSWITTIQAICPKTCNMCTTAPAAAAV